MIFIYIANIIVAGYISICSLFFPDRAVRVIFEDTFASSDAIRLVGALWFGVFFLSCIGIFFPREMQMIFFFQLVYKATWLIVVAGPALYLGVDLPRGMAIFFLIWVIVLPWIIDWAYLFHKSL